MRSIAVTGGIACGKSVAAARLARHDVAICETDEVVHRLLTADDEVCRAVIERFGGDVVGPHGAINRAVLGRQVFADAASRRWLEALLHPRVWQHCRDWLAECKVRGLASTAVVVPLLYEAGWETKAWDVVVCVAAPRSVQLARLAARGHDPDAAEARLNAQLALGEKMRLADRVVCNGGTVGCLHQQIDSLVQELKQRS